MEKSLIIFNAIAHKDVGLGHVYRSLGLAKELSEYEILFVCSNESQGLVGQMVKGVYPLRIFSNEDIFNNIISLRPKAVVNDILSTEAKDILFLKENDVTVINFEDLGRGATCTDLTINELYENPPSDYLKNAGNILWGKDYFFLRDEFLDTEPNIFQTEVSSILITFGGTDPNNLTQVSFSSLADYCHKTGITIYIVTGPGYSTYKELKEATSTKESVYLTHATGVISNIMQKAQIAISSNGRTVFELAHMNVPTLVISQHEREETHGFSNQKNGMVNLGVFNNEISEGVILHSFKKIVEDNNFREQLHKNASEVCFTGKKARVVEIIRETIKK